MDNVSKILVCLLIIILVPFVGYTIYGMYTEREYRSSLVSTYSHSLTISTDGSLRNVTLFIPVPVTPEGNSPFAEQYSTRSFTGIPESWETTLLGSSKATMLKIVTPVVAGSDGTGFSVRTSLDERVAEVIDTRTPQDHAIVLRPLQEIHEVDCREFRDIGAGATCYRYKSAVYAEYEASDGTKVEVNASINGRNDWKIFSPAFNRYSNSLSVVLTGPQRGWTATDAVLLTGIGSYDVPQD